MLDIKFLRANPDIVKQNIKNKFQDSKLPLVDEVIALDLRNREDVYKRQTLSDAITEALIQLGVTSDQLEYDVIEKGSSGFLGIGAKQAVISARRKKTAEAPVELEEIKFDKPKVKPEPKREEKRPPVPAKKAERPAPEAKTVEKEERSSVKVTEETIRESEKFLQDVLKTMDMEVKIHSEVDSEGTLCIELEGEHMEMCIRDSSKSMWKNKG